MMGCADNVAAFEVVLYLGSSRGLDDVFLPTQDGLRCLQKDVCRSNRGLFSSIYHVCCS